VDLDALVRKGARRMLLAALKAEVDEYVAAHADHRDKVGHALVVRNGAAEPRKVVTAAGELEVQAPRVHDRREGRRFTSAILPPWARRSPKVTEVLPVLYLRGISTKDFEPAPAEFFGSEAGLSASTIQRLTRESAAELAAFHQRDLNQVDYVYPWADGCISTFVSSTTVDDLRRVIPVSFDPEGGHDLVAGLVSTPDCVSLKVELQCASMTGHYWIRGAPLEPDPTAPSDQQDRLRPDDAT
jgi:hypothetical protein